MSLFLVLRKAKVHGVTKAKNRVLERNWPIRLLKGKLPLNFQCNHHRCPCWSLYWKDEDRSLIGTGYGKIGEKVA